MEAVLEQIKNFADRAHGDQTRKYTPDRYIVHPIRVMEICQAYTNDLPILAAALLHDVLEDTPVRKEEIFNFLLGLLGNEQAERAVKLVVELTDVYVKDKYPQWNRRKRKTKEAARIKVTSPDSQTIKYADIIDNCKEIVERDPDFGSVFIRECRNLLKVIPDGNWQLYQIARSTVDDCIKKLEEMKK
ncbi:HD domain-containing protein [Pedobacter sp. SYSU D00535]|uniref:HD domain-containing protein n=1 Tax=Pedobacter sp. SYSU D00535 TaxID=2810308 RepID=UPI001A972FAD|nr:HD domain-containing protein [Pedobacter sp. SYSU D00535]